MGVFYHQESTMKVTMLGSGTSSGVPMIACDCEVCYSLDHRDKRLRASVHIEINDQSFVIDTGPDFRQQALRNRILRLDAVLFTHAHKDHTAGLDDVRAYNFRQKCDMPLYGEAHVLEQIQREFAYVFAEEKYPGIPQLALHPIENKPFTIGNTLFTPIRAMHQRLPVLGFRVGNFAYLTDCNAIEPTEMDKLRGCEVIILDALQQIPHPSHFTLAQAVEILEDLRPERAFLTHVSHKMGLHREVEKILPQNIRLGYDDLKVWL